MAYSMAVRSCVLALVVLAVVPQAYAQCNTTLLDVVRSSPQLALLAAVIEAAGLSNAINTTDNVTVLAPNNEAFNGTNGLLQLLAANNLNLTSVTSDGNNRAASILLYHVIPTPATAAQLMNGQSVPTRLGTAYNLTVSKITAATTSTVTFIGAGSNSTVVTADLPVCNSVVHIVDTVLLPATTLTAIPVYNTSQATPGVPPGSAASTLAIGSWVFGLSGALAVALMV